MYHPICISCSRNVILMVCTVDRQPQMAHRMLTLTDALTQEAYNWGAVGGTSHIYKAGPAAQLHRMSKPLFIRHY